MARASASNSVSKGITLHTRRDAESSRRRLLGLVGGLGLATLPAQSRGQCQAVEIYPGYPGYTGYVTGVEGIGDFACLSDLLRQDPSFDLDAEYEANLRAAAVVGLSGEPGVWTWENWMVIEAMRGLPLTCYSCALLAAGTRPEPRGNPVVATDPRLLLGGFGTTTALSRLADDLGTNRSQFVDFLGSDHFFRAQVGMAFPGRWNALEMQARYIEWGETLTTPGIYADVRTLWRNLVDQGGYAPTPEWALPEDQLYMVVVGALALEPLATQEAMEILLGRLEAAESEWRLTGMSGSFGGFLRDLGAGQWFGN